MTRGCVVLGLIAAIGCNGASSSGQQAATAGSGVSDAAIPIADAGGGSGSAMPDAAVIVADAGAGSGSDAAVVIPDAGAGSGSDGGSADDGESDGIDPVVDTTPIGTPDPQLDNCDDLAQRDAQHIDTPDDNYRGRSFECFNRYIARTGGPQLDNQDPAFSPVSTYDGVIPYPTREDQDTADYETGLYLAAAPPATNPVLDILKGIDLQGIADGKYGCEPAKAGHVANPKSGDIWQYMYIPGIQAYDNVPFLTNTGTANRYNNAADWGADSQNNINTFTFPVSEITRWRLFHYHNEPDITAGKAGGPVTREFRKRKWIGPPGDIVGSVVTYSLTTHRTTYEDDKKEVRNLAAWVSAVNQADFIANPPKPDPKAVLAVGPVRPGAGAQITAADFTAWYNGRIAEKAKGGFQWYLRNAAWAAAHSYYCRKPIFAHSGGGPVKLALLRLLDAYSESLAGQPLRKIRARNAVLWRTYGLEEVISREIRTKVEALPSYKDRLVIYNYVENTGGQKGSTTWKETIAKEIGFVGQTPLVKEYQDMHIRVAPATFGHGWIGVTPLYAGVFYSPKTFFPAY